MHQERISLRFANSPSSSAARALTGLGALLVMGLAVGWSAPAVQSQGQNPDLPTVFVVGGSTARNNAGGAQGWGDPFKEYFDATKINVVNRAMAGRSSRSYQRRDAPEISFYCRWATR